MISRLRRDSCLWQIQEVSLIPGLHEFVDQSGGGGEAHGHTSLADGQAQAGGHMGLAGATVADVDDILAALDVFTPGQLHHQRLVQRALFSEGMAGKSKVSRLLTAGKWAARILRSTMRWWRSMSSSSARRSRYSGGLHTLEGALVSSFLYSLKKLDSLSNF